MKKILILMTIILSVGLLCFGDVLPITKQNTEIANREMASPCGDYQICNKDSRAEYNAHCKWLNQDHFKIDDCMKNTTCYLSLIKVRVSRPENQAFLCYLIPQKDGSLKTTISDCKPLIEKMNKLYPKTVNTCSELIKSKETKNIDHKSPLDGTPVWSWP